MGSLANETAPKMLSVQKLDPIFVQPAAKTPEGDYLLSNIDQRMTYVLDCVFTYQNGSIQTMKESLAEVLVEYYPFAGCLTLTSDEKLMVRCTGEGVLFVEAMSDLDIDELGDISVFDHLKLMQLVHLVDGANIVDIPPLTLQVTKFKCGGIALGLSFNHVLTDGISLVNFLNSWGETARKNPLSVHPFLDRSMLSSRQPPKVEFSHPELLDKKYTCISTRHAEPHVYNSICFDPQMLNKLKELSKDEQSNTNPTKFEVITALAWLLRTKSLRLEAHETTKLLIAVDVRSKFKPPLPKGYFGNATTFACAECKAGELIKNPLSAAVKMVHDAICSVSEEYLKSSIDHYELKRVGLEFRNTCYITKWSSLAFYDLDFGWGKPKQFAPASVVDNLMVVNLQEYGSQNTVLSLGLPPSAMEIFEELMHFILTMEKVAYSSGNGCLPWWKSCTYSCLDKSQ